VGGILCKKLIKKNRRNFKFMGKLNYKAFVGFDGFIDQMIRVVKSRESEQSYTPYDTIKAFAKRLDEASGKSAGIEVVTQEIRFGGNGPLMANALAILGVKNTCIGALGFPTLNPAYNNMHMDCKHISVCNPAYTYAYEFNDGKIMLADMAQLFELTWGNIKSRIGIDALVKEANDCTLIALANWSYMDYMHPIWQGFYDEVMPRLDNRERTIFFDLADPTKRSKEDIIKILKLMGNYSKYGKTILGLNLNEAIKISRELTGIETDNIIEMATTIREFSQLDVVVVHPLDRSAWVSSDYRTEVMGKVCEKPALTTGGGDNFNAGLCVGVLSGLSPEDCLKKAMETSYKYVSTGSL
jgi:hypothetical protein